MVLLNIHLKEHRRIEHLENTEQLEDTEETFLQIDGNTSLTDETLTFTMDQIDGNTSLTETYDANHVNAETIFSLPEDPQSSGNMN